MGVDLNPLGPLLSEVIFNLIVIILFITIVFIYFYIARDLEAQTEWQHIPEDVR